MNIYELTPPGAKVLSQIRNPTDGQRLRVPVRTTWEEAMGRVLADVARTGCARFLILVGHAEIIHAPPKGQRYRAGNATLNGLVLYMDRLLRQYAGAVYLPPLGGLDTMRIGWEEYCPVAAMVAAYRADAVLGVPPGPEMGRAVVGKGYRTITLSDYAYTQQGPTVLPQKGTQPLWKKANEKALAPYL